MELVPLERLLQVIAPSILNLRGAARPRDAATGRADARAVAAACEGAAAACTATELLTLNVSGETARGAPAAPPWGDPETRELVHIALFLCLAPPSPPPSPSPPLSPSPSPQP